MWESGCHPRSPHCASVHPARAPSIPGLRRLVMDDEEEVVSYAQVAKAVLLLTPLTPPAVRPYLWVLFLESHP